ncbi:MAG: amidohydrolase [Clostridia bacterium]
MLLIYNANINTVTNGVIEDGYILVENDKIEDVGLMDDINIDDFDCKKIDATNKLVFPGFIEAHCHLGLSESAIRFEGSDHNETTDPITPNMRGLDGINPMDITFKEALEAGVTTVNTGPGSANIIGGTFAIIKTAGGKRIDDMIVREPSAMKCAFGENPKRVYNGKNKMPTTRMAIAALFRETLSKTQQYLAKKEAAGDDISKLPNYDAKLEALIPVIKREIPIKAHAHRADDIFTAIRIAKEFNLKMTIDHTTEGHLIANELFEENYPCIVGPSFGHRSKFELKEKSFETPKVLSEAGVNVAITTDSPVVPLDKLPLMAGLACKEGMDRDEALKAITINPARILEIDDLYGSIEKNKCADLVIINKHPFEVDAKVSHVIVSGELVVEK